MTTVVIDTNLGNSEFLSDPITSDLLGVNLLSGFEKGDDVVDGETFDDLIDDLLGEDTSTSGTSSMTVRFPGGTLTEDFWEDPEATLTIDTPIGVANGSDEPMSTVECINLCAANNYRLDLVIPTFRYVVTDPVTGQQSVNVNMAEIEAYVYETLMYAYECGVEVVSIEVGNEWWSDDPTGDAMSAEQYGEIASQVSVAAQNAIDAFEEDLASAGVDMSEWEEPAILVQLGTGSDSTEETEAILESFDTVEEQSAVDGFNTHRYESTSVGHIGDPWVDDNIYLEDSLGDLLVGDGWKDADEMILAVTEWNLGSSLTATGLQSYSATVLLFAEMVAHGVDQANFWSAEDRSKFSLTLHESGNSESSEYLGLSFTGEAFRMLEESTVGLSCVNLFEQSNDGKIVTMHDGNSFDQQVFAVTAFADEGTLVIFISNNTGTTQSLDLDVSGTVGSECFAWATTVGVAEGEDPFDQYAVPVVTNYTGDEFDMADGTLEDFELGPYETVRITISYGEIRPEILGYTGNDELCGSDYSDIIYGREGNDSASGHDGNDTIYGEEGNDKIYGGNGDKDRLYGGDGDDSIGGGTGNDTLDGGAGFDTALFEGSTSVKVTLHSTSAQVTGVGTDTLISFENITSGTGADSLTGSSGGNVLKSSDGCDTLSGMDGSDKLYGGNQSDHLYGGSGADSLYGEGGADRLEGGAGSDYLKGGSGIDTLIGGSGCDIFVFAGTSDCGDKIQDFSNKDSSNNDTIYLSASAFGDDFDLGMIDATQLLISRSANCASNSAQDFIFRTSDSTLWFDSNGSKAGGAILIADFSDGTMINAGDIVFY